MYMYDLHVDNLFSVEHAQVNIGCEQLLCRLTFARTALLPAEQVQPDDLLLLAVDDADVTLSTLRIDDFGRTPTEATSLCCFVTSPPSNRLPTKRKVVQTQVLYCQNNNNNWEGEQTNGTINNLCSWVCQ